MDNKKDKKEKKIYILDGEEYEIIEEHEGEGFKSKEEEEEFIREFEEFMDAIDRERRERILMYRTAVSSHKSLPN